MIFLASGNKDRAGMDWIVAPFLTEVTTVLVCLFPMAISLYASWHRKRTI